MKNEHTTENRSGGSIPILLAVVAAAVGFIAYNSLYTVNEWEQAIVVQFGEIIGDPVTEAGLHFKRPFIQQVYRFDRRLLRWDGKETTTITKDRKTVVINVTARWRISDARRFLETVRSPELAVTRLNGVIEGAVKDEIAKYDLYEVVRSSNLILEPQEEPVGAALLAEEVDAADMEDLDLSSLGGSVPPLRQDARGRYQAGRPIVMAGILKEARSRLDQIGLGIHLEDVLIKQLNYSAAIEANVYAQMNAELQKISAGFRSIGRQRAEEKLGEMERELATIQSQAIEQSERIRGEAEAEAIKIYAEAYNQDPEFYRFLRTLQSYERILGPNSTILIGSDSPLYELFKKVE